MILCTTFGIIVIINNQYYYYAAVKTFVFIIIIIIIIIIILYSGFYKILIEKLVCYYYYYYYYYVEFSTGIFPGEKYPVKSHSETSDFQHFSEDMCRSKECWLLHRSCSVLNSYLLQVACQLLWHWTQHAYNHWHHFCPWFPDPFNLSCQVLVLFILFSFFLQYITTVSPRTAMSTMIVSFAFFFWITMSGLLWWISRSIWMVKSHNSLTSSFSSTLLGECSYHLSLHLTPYSLHTSQWMTHPTTSCLSLYCLCKLGATTQNMLHSFIVTTTHSVLGWYILIFDPGFYGVCS